MITEPESEEAATESEPSALALFGSLKSDVPFPGTQEEKAAIREDVAQQAAEEGPKQ